MVEIIVFMLQFRIMLAIHEVFISRRLIVEVNKSIMHVHESFYSPMYMIVKQIIEHYTLLISEIMTLDKGICPGVSVKYKLMAAFACVTPKKA